MSTNNPGQGDELEPVSFQPLPNIITAFSADASPFEALAESVDNSIDHIRSRAYDGQTPEEDLEVEIEFQAGEGDEPSRIIIEDNAGGVEADNLSRFFQWGASDTAPESIGRFGVGASRIAALGGIIKYQSRTRGQETGYGFQVNVSEMETHDGEVTDDTYQAQRQVIEDLDEGHTRIIIEDLKRDFTEVLSIDHPSESDDEVYEDLEQVPENAWENAIQQLSDQFGDYFERYITDGISFEASYFPEKIPEIDVSIEVGVDLADRSFVSVASPPTEIEYSYLPFDSLGPRRYQGLPFDEEDDVASADAAIRADIEVGLMLSSDDEKSGLTIYANDRKIISRDTSNPLFSSDYLGRYRSESGHSRLVINVELRGEISEMPINSLKSDLDMNSPVSDPLLRIIKNAAKRYRKQTYSSMPAWILSVYDQNHSFAANGGEVQTFDKSSSTTNSARFRNQPGNGGGRRTFPERDRVRAIVKVHRALRIRDETPLYPKEIPAYDNYFEQKYTKDVGNSEYVLTGPEELEGPDLDWDEVSITADDEKLEIISWILRVSKNHFDAGGRADETDELVEWQIPRYQEELRKRTSVTDLDESQLEVWDQIPEQVLLATLTDLSSDLDEIPERSDLETFAPGLVELYEDRFGSWDSTLESAGLAERVEVEETSESSQISSSGGIQQGEPGETTDTSDAAETGQQTIGDSSQNAQSGIEPSTAAQSRVEGSGIVIDGEYYRISEEDEEMIEEILEDSEADSPQDAWEEIKQVLEWYQQMPN